MTKAKHTPGPWIATDVPHVQTDTARVGFLTTVADCRIGGHSHDEMVANAHLIASAPDLLKQLEDAAHWLKDLSLIARREGNTGLATRVTEQASKAYAAIAKARGEAV